MIVCLSDSDNNMMSKLTVMITVYYADQIMLKVKKNDSHCSGVENKKNVTSEASNHALPAMWISSALTFSLSMKFKTCAAKA